MIITKNPSGGYWVSVWHGKHLSTKHLLFPFPVNCFSPHWNLRYLPYPLAQNGTGTSIAWPVLGSLILMEFPYICNQTFLQLICLMLMYQIFYFLKDRIFFFLLNNIMVFFVIRFPAHSNIEHLTKGIKAICGCSSLPFWGHRDSTSPHMDWDGGE